MPSDGPLGSPLARAINLRVADLGGQPLRYKMLEGKAQFWVVVEGRTMAAAKLQHLAKTLSVSLNGEKMTAEQTRPTDLINAAQASKITGYSSGVFWAAGRRGDLKIHKLGSHTYRMSKSEVLAWAEHHRKKGGIYLPRKNRANGAVREKTTKMVHLAGDSKSGKGFYPSIETHARMMRYIEKLGGLMTAQEFTERVIRQALDKLGA